MVDIKSTTHRRGFLGSLVASAAAIGITTLPATLRVAAAPKEHYKQWENTEFDAWLNKIKGKHRQVFDAPGVNKGFPLAWSRVFLMTNKQVGVADDDVTAVVILRHEAICLGMGHDLWAKYKFGEVFKVEDDATKAPAIRNPFHEPKEGELKLPGMAIEDLQKSGVLFGICDMALTFYSKFVFAPKMGMEADAIKKEWVSGIFPDIQIVPSGVLAVNRAQEYDCTYCYAG